MDVDDKITVLKEKINEENIANATIRSMVSMVGEVSNLATKILSRVPKNEEEKQKYKDYVDLLSIIINKVIDYQKTGVLWLPPKNISKLGKISSYFMKYISPYYAKMKRLSVAPCNMNQLCWDIERWQKELRKKIKKSSKPFDYKIMIDYSIHWNAETYLQVKNLYKQFQSDLKELKKQQRMSYKNSSYYNYFNQYDKQLIQSTEIDWTSVFLKYKQLAHSICPNECELANYTVTMCYGEEEINDEQNNKGLKENNRDKHFAWITSENGIIKNLKPTEIMLPMYDRNGEYEYLGKKYSLVPYIYNEADFKDNQEDIMIEDEENYEVEENEEEFEDTYI